MWTFKKIWVNENKQAAGLEGFGKINPFVLEFINVSVVIWSNKRQIKVETGGRRRGWRERIWVQLDYNPPLTKWVCLQRARQKKKKSKRGKYIIISLLKLSALSKSFKSVWILVPKLNRIFIGFPWRLCFMSPTDYYYYFFFAFCQTNGLQLTNYPAITCS